MKILIINTYEIHGGAARAANRLHKALRSIGVESEMLVRSKTSNDPSVFELKNPWLQNSFRPILDALPVKYYRNKTTALFSPAWVPFSGIVKKINASDADLVHLHWVAHGLIRIEDLAKIKKPIIWSLHDMWAFTGGCHYDWGCGKYARHCEKCPVLSSKKRNDISYRIFERKAKTFTKITDLTIIGLSRWLAGCAENSALLAEKNIVNLPNPIDTNIFKPLNKENSRQILNLPQDKKLVLFGADTRDPRKGFTELSNAMNKLKSENIELVVFGSGKSPNASDFAFPVHFLGYLPGDSLLRTLYSAADVLVVSSLQEAFGQTASESMACGTPVVAFGATGLLDIVDHQKNGFLAIPYDSNNLAEGIDWVLNYSSSQELPQNARQKVMENFEAVHVARQYLNVYKTVLENSKTTV